MERFLSNWDTKMKGEETSLAFSSFKCVKKSMVTFGTMVSNINSIKKTGIRIYRIPVFFSIIY